MFCDNCGHEVEHGSNFCPKCGAKQPNMEVKEAEVVISEDNSEEVKEEENSEEAVEHNQEENTVEKVTEVMAVETQENAKQEGEIQENQ